MNVPDKVGKGLRFGEAYLPILSAGEASEFTNSAKKYIGRMGLAPLFSCPELSRVLTREKPHALVVLGPNLCT